ncbi:OTU-like cysteine protease [Carpediemonas membranifera]|uniref:Ubiquitin thioesterase OTU n=1 Tax=Carpediemonas membranifera TaxID=201153 RepID=A0A8J6B8J3_9EUKA|nr:OTU-like cysteine protease [Carpediemonas membranifera]|eukprot:KAG9394952.1 OTU-like cysteine protease [Carpediemonas membranifera]
MSAHKVRLRLENKNFIYTYTNESTVADLMAECEKHSDLTNAESITVQPLVGGGQNTCKADSTDLLTTILHSGSSMALKINYTTPSPAVNKPTQPTNQGQPPRPDKPAPHSQRAISTDLDWSDFDMIRQYSPPQTPDWSLAEVCRLTTDADGACLFHAVTSLFASVDPHLTHYKLRHAAVTTIMDNQHDERFSEAMLGMDIGVYVSQMRAQDTWGGGIELAILSDVLHVELAVVDVADETTVVFGEGAGWSKRGYLLFFNDHYESLGIEAGGVMHKIFSPGDDIVYTMMLSFSADILEQERRSVYICSLCGGRLVGQTALSKHAKLTGHDKYEMEKK